MLLCYKHKVRLSLFFLFFFQKIKLGSFVVKSHTTYLISFGLNYKLHPLILFQIQFSLAFKLHFRLIQVFTFKFIQFMSFCEM